MVSAAGVRRIASALPGARDDSTAERLVFSVDGKGFAWSFMMRAAPKRPRHPDLKTLAVRCPVERKEMLIEAAPDIYFDDAHYRGYPAVLVRLAVVEKKELRALLESACLLQTPKPKQRVKAPAKKRARERSS